MCHEIFFSFHLIIDLVWIVGSSVFNKILSPTGVDCVYVRTAFDRNGPYTRAAWGIGVSMAVVILLLVIFKSKFLSIRVGLGGETKSLISASFV